MKRFYLHRLGCPKNDVDAEYMAGYLRDRGLEEVDNPEQADVLIVNSCGFIQPAKEESIGAVLSLAEVKKAGAGKRLIITGCLSQRYANQLAADIPELDGVLGLNDFAEIDHLLAGETGRIIRQSENPRIYPKYDFNRQVRAGEAFAYIKISDGCDNRCSYCAIPDIRGHYRSREIDDICAEAEFLLSEGKRELILVSQESTAYGVDLYGESRLTALLERLSGFSERYWIRIMYMHPAHLSRELIDYVIDNPVICSYFDLPLQHINDDMLRAMKRRATRADIEDTLDAIRGRSEDVAIRTNFIVGFPGETAEHFAELCAFVEERRFDRLGAFAYSAEEGTPATNLPNQIGDRVREERYHRLMEQQQQIAFELNDDMIGRHMKIFVDSIDSTAGRIIGRSRFDAPEIDQIVLVSGTEASIGEILTVRITGNDGYDLLGERETV